MAASQIWVNFGKSQIYNGDYCMQVVSFSKGSECLLFFSG